MTIISDLAAWLASNGYEDLDAWMADSDYSCTRDTDDRIIGWADEDGNEVNPVDVATYAMEAAAEVPAGKPTDAEVLDRLAYLLSAPEWPGASGMEDVAELVRSTGRHTDHHDAVWRSH